MRPSPSPPNSRRDLLATLLLGLPLFAASPSLLAASDIERALQRLGGSRGTGGRLSQTDASGGIKEALAQGVDRSIRQSAVPTASSAIPR